VTGMSTPSNVFDPDASVMNHRAESNDEDALMFWECTKLELLREASFLKSELGNLRGRLRNCGTLRSIPNLLGMTSAMSLNLNLMKFARTNDEMLGTSQASKDDPLCFRGRLL
jgi:hypothetical protein